MTMPVSGDVNAELPEYIINGGFHKALQFPDVEARRLYTKSVIGEISILQAKVLPCRFKHLFHDRDRQPYQFRPGPGKPCLSISGGTTGTLSVWGASGSWNAISLSARPMITATFKLP